ncbi:metal ABC transporter solute-binding protein, Zn/Mn family [Lentibacillus saliphilus]|uniref:metal ABC transporter solute-binding protein, Zn/Mn family n=1 Tax=Lentibacillus saliphilus TaxID=2737028 RepID=UPI00248496CC|nr:zinc ABC transporter substrate-binding protein [Lentibacillus saliphilus]
MNGMKKIVMGMVFILFVFGLTACSDTDDSTASNDGEGKIHIVTTIAQIAEPISVIGGDFVEVDSLMGPGVDPHLYQPTQGDIKKLNEADVVLYGGLNLEGNMIEAFERIGEQKPVVAVSEAISEDQLLLDEEGAIDPHVWFDITLWKTALTEATDALKSYAPDHEDTFEKNKEAYFAKLDELLDDATEKMTAIPDEQRVLVTAHDAFGYFGRAYDMDVVGLQGLSTEDEIGISDIDNTVDLLMEYEIPAVFIESSINENSIRAVIEGAEKNGLMVELGGELYSDAMGDADTEEGTYIGMYRHNVKTIYEALSGVDN